VTLAPVKSNTGIGKPVRPRPKIESPDTTLLEELFGVRDYKKKTYDKDTTNTASISESVSSHKIQNSTKSDKNESSNHKNGTIVEQIIEVVTSISTRVSSNINSDPIILKFIVTNSTLSTNSTTNSNVHSERR